MNIEEVKKRNPDMFTTIKIKEEKETVPKKETKPSKKKSSKLVVKKSDDKFYDILTKTLTIFLSILIVSFLTALLIKFIIFLF